MQNPREYHTSVNVHIEMLYQVARDYASVDVLKLTASQIRFFYDGLRAEIRQHQKGGK